MEADKNGFSLSTTCDEALTAAKAAYQNQTTLHWITDEANTRFDDHRKVIDWLSLGAIGAGLVFMLAAAPFGAIISALGAAVGIAARGAELYHIVRHLRRRRT